MGLSRRFLNVIMDHTPGLKSLRCIDLERHKFFNTTTPALRSNGSGSESTLAPTADAASEKNDQFVTRAAALKIGRIQLPSPIFSFASVASDEIEPQLHCFPVADRKVFCMYHHGGSFLVEVDLPQLVTMPRVHKPNLVPPICLFIPSTEPYDNMVTGGGGSFVIMYRNPNQYEGFIYHKRSSASYFSSWNVSTPIPPPPPPPYDKSSCSEIRSYAVVDGISQICVSLESAGTFCLDMANYTWREEGKWILPFYGKFEYVPELKLWFGFSEDRLLIAADLSTQPRLLGTWKEFEPPEEWQEFKDPQLVNLGSGRFCVTRFFCPRTPHTLIEPTHPNFAVLTGVEVILPLLNGNGNRSNEQVKLVVHRSKYHKSSGADGIAAVL